MTGNADMEEEKGFTKEPTNSWAQIIYQILTKKKMVVVRHRVRVTGTFKKL